MLRKFVKMQGLGNDFILFDDLDADNPLKLTLKEVVHLCDRHFGIGADGIMILRATAGADIAWDFYNSDGSVAEMCGNAARCLARYAFGAGLWPAGSDTLHLETLAGVKMLEVVRDADGVFEAARVDMGIAELGGQLKIEGYDWQKVSMGNPHAVTFVDILPYELGTAPVTTIGPILEADETFPHKTNVEFAQVLDDERIRMRVWERGVGETMACATGACAVAVAAKVQGLTTADVVTVELLGGELQVEVQPDMRVIMTGPAEQVFEGILAI
jgi:diaminopimelate epimerase